MILFYGRRDDPPLALALEAAVEMRVDHVVVEQSRLPHYHLHMEQDGHAANEWLRVDGRTIRLDAVRGVYARILDLEDASDPISTRRAELFHRSLIEWLDAAPARVVNRPCSMESNASKPYQMQCIARAGFLVPETLVTTEVDEVIDFWRRHGRVVYKSLSGIRSIVQELDAASAKRLSAIRWLPTQFQAFVEGIDVRVHVVGKRTFATELSSRAIDYRYAARDGLDVASRAIDLPDDVAARCVDLAAALELPLCGIDLRRAAAGDWVCFEANPMPAFSYYELSSGVPISRALIELLASSGLDSPD